jgi:hypothetical protein
MDGKVGREKEIPSRIVYTKWTRVRKTMMIAHSVHRLQRQIKVV